MSNMIPDKLVRVIKKMNDFAVDTYGIDCELYIPQNWSLAETEDAYRVHEDIEYKLYHTRVWVDWTPTKSRLQKYGLFLEDDIPIIAMFSNKLSDASGFDYETDILVNSYFTIPLQYVPNQFKSEALEIVDVLIPAGMHDQVSLKAYKIAPKRTKAV